MKQYTKPEFYVEEFHPNVVVAACERDFSGNSTTSYDPQMIGCLRGSSTTNDYLFTSGVSGCTYQPNAIGFLQAGTYSTGQISDALGYNINGSGSSVTVPSGGSYVVIWGDGNHYGIATAEIIKIMINSY